jgi:glutamate synthase domain-containing protein 2
MAAKAAVISGSPQYGARKSFMRVTLKTGAYSAVELAMALRYGAEAKLVLLTIDGAPGGTGMSPLPMMNEWGIPTAYIQSLAYQYAELLKKRGIRVPDLAIAGGIADAANGFKALCMGAPYFKAVCMGRALMIPGMVGKNIQKWLDAGELPKNVSKYGGRVEEIFVCYEELKEKYGARISDIPLGAMGIYSYVERYRLGMQQMMAGSRNFSLKSISRNDLMTLTEESAKVTGIPYVMDAYSDAAEVILLS